MKSLNEMGLHEQQSHTSNYAPKKKWKQWYMSCGDESEQHSLSANDEHTHGQSEPCSFIANGSLKEPPSHTPTVTLTPTSYSQHAFEKGSSGPSHQFLSVEPRRSHALSPSPLMTGYVDPPVPSGPDPRLASQFGSPLSLKGILHTTHHESLSISSSSSSSESTVLYGSPTRINEGAVRALTLDSPGLSNDALPVVQLNGLRPASCLTPPTHSEDLLEYKEDNMRKRAGSTPSREVHNKLEKNRRAHLKECFEGLRKTLPSMDDKKISNQTILKAAHRYIQGLKRKEREYEHEMERLARQKIAYQQQLASLKKELHSKWDHIDFSRILPDPSSMDINDKDTKSTSSAPENPDYDEKRSKTVPGQSYFIPKLPTPRQTASPEVVNDMDQPLDLCTNSFQNQKRNEWVVRRNSVHPYSVDDKSFAARTANPSHSPAIKLNSHKLSPGSTYSTNLSHNGAFSQIAISPSIGNSVQHISQLVKAGTTVSHVPSVAKVVTSLPHVQASETTISPICNAFPTQTNIVPLPTVTRISNLHSTGTTISRVPTNAPPAAAKQPLRGIQLPAHIMTTGGVSPSAIQVINPEVYKLLSTADHTTNGGKPMAITLAQTDGYDQFTSDDGKPRSFMVAVNKNGLSTLHLTVPASISNSSVGTTIPVTSVPLNLTVGAPPTAEMSQSGSASLIPSYIPLTNSNGLARLMPGMSVVGPIVMSPPQSKALKSHSVGSTSVSLVPTQYASTFSGGLVNSVMVMSTSTNQQ